MAGQNHRVACLLYALYILMMLAQSAESFMFHKICRKREMHKSVHIVDDEFVNATQLRTKDYLRVTLKSRVLKLLNVPDVMQATDYTCGPSSLSAVLSYYSIIYREMELAKMAKTIEDFGTGPQDMVNAIRSLNISASMYENMTVTDLENSINNNRPVIVLFQAWADDPMAYPYDFEDGHYVVVIGYDQNYLYFEDPWIQNSIGYITKK